MLLCGGASKRSIGERFGLDHDAVLRHWHRHLSDDRKAALIAGTVPLGKLADLAADEGAALIDHFRLLRGTLYLTLQCAVDAGDRAGVASVAGRIVEVLNAMGKLTGELTRASGVTINNNLIMSSPIFVDLETTLLRVLAPFHDARVAVIAALRELEERRANLPSPANVTDAVYSEAGE
jgi:hypothetical protein